MLGLLPEAEVDVGVDVEATGVSRDELDSGDEDWSATNEAVELARSFDGTLDCEPECGRRWVWFYLVSIVGRRRQVVHTVLNPPSGCAFTRETA